MKSLNFWPIGKRPANIHDVQTIRENPNGQDAWHGANSDLEAQDDTPTSDDLERFAKEFNHEESSSVSPKMMST